METQQPGEILNRLEAPRMQFTIAGNSINLEDALSSGEKRSSAMKWHEPEVKPGDAAAQRMLYVLETSGVTIEEYRTAMPRLFEHAAKKEGGYDSAYIGLFLKACDITASRMGQDLGNPMFENTWRSSLGKELRPTFYSRAYGYTEALKDQILSQPNPNADLRTRAEMRQRLEEIGRKNHWLNKSG